MALIAISHGITAIRQPGPNDCWAAASAMVRGLGASVASVRRMAAAATPPVRLHPNGSLVENDPENARRLAGAVGLQSRDVRTTPVTFEAFLGHARRGSFVILGGFNYPSRGQALNHAVAVYGMAGDDSTPDRVNVRIVDPFDGRNYDFRWDLWSDEIMADPHFFLTR